MDNENFITIKEACEKYSVERMALWAMIRANKFVTEKRLVNSKYILYILDNGALRKYAKEYNRRKAYMKKHKEKQRTYPKNCYDPSEDLGWWKEYNKGGRTNRTDEEKPVISPISCSVKGVW